MFMATCIQYKFTRLKTGGYHMLMDSKTDQMLYFGIETLHGSGKASRSRPFSISSIMNVKFIRIDTLYVIQ